MRKTLTTLAALAVGAIFGAAGCTATSPDAAATPAPVVHCPTEDSCEVDYRDGAWFIRTADDSPTTQTPGPWVRVSR